MKLVKSLSTQAISTQPRFRGNSTWSKIKCTRHQGNFISEQPKLLITHVWISKEFQSYLQCSAFSKVFSRKAYNLWALWFSLIFLSIKCLHYPLPPFQKAPGFHSLNTVRSLPTSVPCGLCQSFSCSPRNSELSLSLSLSPPLSPLPPHVSLRIASTFLCGFSISLSPTGSHIPTLHPHLTPQTHFFLPQTSFAPDLLLVTVSQFLNLSLHSVSLCLPSSKTGYPFYWLFLKQSISSAPFFLLKLKKTCF